MFVGSVMPQARAFMKRLIEGSIEVSVGCSGNFTLERLALSCGIGSVTGNDVSLYSCSIGNFLVGRKTDVSIDDEEFRWLEPYLDGGINQIAAISLCLEMLKFHSKKRRYDQRMFAAYQTKFDDLQKKTAEKFRQILDGVKLKDFVCGDVVDFCETATGCFMSFPPTYKGGYEKIYKPLDAVFGWDAPKYQIFDEPRMEMLIDLMLEKERWVLISDVEREDMDANFVGQKSLFTKPVYVYCRSPGLVGNYIQRRPTSNVPACGGDHITADSKISVRSITTQQMTRLRSLYLAPSIPISNTMPNLVVEVDGLVVGAMGFCRTETRNYDGDMQLQCDFSVGGHPRLSKLILAMSLTHEVKHLLEETIAKSVDNISTAIYTDRPASMKYRGIYQLRCRSKRGRLTYTADAGRWSIEEGFDWWKKKYLKK